MIELPPICQSPAGNGGESNGAGGIRRGGGVAPGSGGVEAGVPNCSRNASSRRFKNGSFILRAIISAFACSSFALAALAAFAFALSVGLGASCARDAGTANMIPANNAQIAMNRHLFRFNCSPLGWLKFFSATDRVRDLV